MFPTLESTDALGLAQKTAMVPVGEPLLSRPLTQIGYVRAIVEGYDGVAVVHAPDPNRGEIEWLIGEGLEDEADTLARRLGARPGSSRSSAPLIGLRARFCPCENSFPSWRRRGCCRRRARASAGGRASVVPAESSLTYTSFTRCTRSTAPRTSSRARRASARRQGAGDGARAVGVVRLGQRQPRRAHEGNGRGGQVSWIELKALAEGITPPTTFPRRRRRHSRRSSTFTACSRCSSCPSRSPGNRRTRCTPRAFAISLDTTRSSGRA